MAEDVKLSLDDIYQKLSDMIGKMEDDIGTTLTDWSSKGTLTTAQVQQLSFMMNKWSVCTQCQSNTIKCLADGMKSVVQNIS